MSDSIKIKVVKHYSEDDTAFLGDVWYIRIYINQAGFLREYTDVKNLDGYLDALVDFFGESELDVTYEQVADQI